MAKILSEKAKQILGMFHSRIKNDASMDSKAWDFATALTYTVIYVQAKGNDRISHRKWLECKFNLHIFGNSSPFCCNSKS